MNIQPDADQQTPTVLIVDDVPANLDVLVEHLQREAVHLVVALSGEEGLRLAKEIGPDLILLDVMMPGIDGFETCRRLKADQDTNDIPVVFLTAREDELDTEKGLRLGAVDYISKPFSMPILKARLRNHLALKRKSNLLLQLACTDELTRVGNRRHFNKMLHSEWGRATRNQTPLSLVMLDVDYFKRFNDHYGHPEGDRCLAQIAGALDSVLHRPSDMLARYGGEEFVVLLPETERDGAAAIAEQLHASVFNLALPHQSAGTEGRVTISLGVATAVPAALNTPEDLLAWADNALYQAKAQGRNQVFVAAEMDQ
ncbi:diguanylate cyclase domain-containing protein [Halopseudomonas sabulinigri]|uniref:diguanylate cyclase n=1 Tax=Halopseudomonas sabulinigri TaxID=472181 RepID=A0ABP9ZL52_9GAMM